MGLFDSLILEDSIEDLPGEKWKAISGFEGYYEVSNLGRVKGVSRKVKGNKFIPSKLLQPVGSRYKSVSLWRNNKGYNRLVHRLVAEAFIPNPDNLPEVNHKDLDITNNCVSNLEWVTASANHNHGVDHKPKGKPYRRQVKCLETNQIFPSISAAGRSVDADATQIVESIEAQRCCKGKTFVYLDNLPSDIDSYLKIAHEKYQNFHFRPSMKNSRKVRCIETNQEFDSIASAARFYKCDTATISLRIKEHRTVEGSTLEFMEDR